MVGSVAIVVDLRATPAIVAHRARAEALAELANASIRADPAAKSMLPADPGDPPPPSNRQAGVRNVGE